MKILRLYLTIFLNVYLNFHAIKYWYYAAVNFNPKIPTSIKQRNTIRKIFTGSLKRKIPSNTAPKAPIPVQMAYAVPIGSVLAASDSK